MLLAKKTLASAFLILLLCVLAHAQAARVYVTANRGSDLNPCTRLSPCRTIQHALATTVVQPGGDVVILDSGDYSPFAISASASPATVTSVTVEAAPGIVAAITATSGNGIDITAGTPSSVVLRGLSLNGLGSTQDGINVASVGLLYIENCIVNGFTNKGINVSLSEFGSQIFIKDTIVRFDRY